MAALHGKNMKATPSSAVRLRVGTSLAGATHSTFGSHSWIHSSTTQSPTTMPFLALVSKVLVLACHCTVPGLQTSPIGPSWVLCGSRQGTAPWDHWWKPDPTGSILRFPTSLPSVTATLSAWVLKEAKSASIPKDGPCGMKAQFLLARMAALPSTLFQEVRPIGVFCMRYVRI